MRGECHGLQRTSLHIGSKRAARDRGPVGTPKRGGVARPCGSRGRHAKPLNRGCEAAVGRCSGTSKPARGGPVGYRCGAAVPWGRDDGVLRAANRGLRGRYEAGLGGRRASPAAAGRRRRQRSRGTAAPSHGPTDNGGRSRHGGRRGAAAVPGLTGLTPRAPRASFSARAAVANGGGPPGPRHAARRGAQRPARYQSSGSVERDLSGAKPHCRARAHPHGGDKPLRHAHRHRGLLRERDATQAGQSSSDGTQRHERPKAARARAAFMGRQERAATGPTATRAPKVQAGNECLGDP